MRNIDISLVKVKKFQRLEKNLDLFYWKIESKIKFLQDYRGQYGLPRYQLDREVKKLRAYQKAIIHLKTLNPDSVH